jgi:O-antigen ligase
VFRFFNTQYAPDIKTTRFYRDAHSDWLQSLAEHGFVGTALLALCGVVPLLRLRRRHLASPLPTYLLAGCALVLLYAWVEFPFGNVAVVLVWWLSFFCAVHYARLYDREAPAPVKSGSASG